MMTLDQQKAHYRAVRARIMAASVYRNDFGDEPAPAPASPPAPKRPLVPPPTYRMLYDFPIGPSRTAVQPFRKTAREVLHEVAEEYGVSVEALKSGKRAAALVRARQAACYRMRAETRLTLPQIGRALGGRDHTTVLWGCRRHAALLKLPDAGMI